MRVELARSPSHRLFFAGEASEQNSCGTAHGACLSGQRRRRGSRCLSRGATRSGLVTERLTSRWRSPHSKRDLNPVIPRSSLCRSVYPHVRGDNETITIPLDSLGGTTPLGIRGRITSIKDVQTFADNMCSTPLGIRGRITRDGIQPKPSPPSAQRLSASEEGSLREAITGDRFA